MSGKSKISVVAIVRDQLATLTAGIGGGPRPLDYAWFLGFPLLVGGAALVADVPVPRGGVLLTAVAVLAGLLFNLLLLVFDVAVKLAGDVERLEANQQSTEQVARLRLRIDLVRQIHASIAYAVLVSLAMVIDLVVVLAITPTNHDPNLALSVAFWTVGTNLVLTLLMILKRVHSVLSGIMTELGIGLRR